MDDFTQRYAQTLFERDYPAPPPEPVESKPAAASTTGSRARAQETAPGVADAGTALMDMLAGALKGAVAQTIGLPGDVESLYHAMFGGRNKLVTTEDVQKLLPPVVPAGDTAREHTAKIAEKMGEFLPVAPVGIVKEAVRAAKGAKVIKYGADGKRLATEPAK